LTTAPERIRKPSSFNLEAPSGSEDGPTDYTAFAITISKIKAVLVGTSSPSVTWTLRYAADRSAAGTEVVIGGTTTTSVSGVDVTVLDNPTIPADNFFWIETTAQSGTVEAMTITAVYK
jgi:hypothetical protein